jgi:hypothetical protein
MEGDLIRALTKGLTDTDDEIVRKALRRGLSAETGPEVDRDPVRRSRRRRSRSAKRVTKKSG